MPLSTRRRIVAAKIETTAGTPIALADADTAFFGYDGAITNNVAFTSRTAAGSLSQVTAEEGIESGQFTFKTDLYTAAPWESILLPALGMVSATGVWSPSDTITDWKWLTLGQNIAGKLKTLSGAMGSAVINLVAGEIPTVDWTFLGRYEAEADQAQFTPAHAVAAYSAASKLGSAVVTLGGTAICFARATIGIANTLSLILCATKSGGIQYAWIEGREITLSIDPLEELAASRNDDGIQRAGTLQAFSFAFGSMLIAMPKCQLRQITPGERNGLSARTLNFVGTMNAAAGDELTIDLATA